MNNPKFEIAKDNRGEYRFILRAVNGEIILQSSEGYSTKQGCQNSIDSVKINAPFDSRYKKESAFNEKYYFTLHAVNHLTLGISEMYNSSYGRDNGIEAVKRDAPTAPVLDHT